MLHILEVEHYSQSPLEHPVGSSVRDIVACKQSSGRYLKPIKSTILKVIKC